MKELSMPDVAGISKDHRRVIADRNVEAILEAAERLLERGAQISISAVAAEAELSRVTVYAHFPTREHVLKAIVVRTVHASTANMDTTSGLDEGSAADALDRLVTASWRGLDRHQALAHATAHLSADERWQLHETLVAGIQRLIDRGRAQGIFRDDLPTAWLVASFYALIHAAGDEVRAGRLTPSAAPDVLSVTVRSLILRQPC
jgi:TetR/AcrR family transcriptional repressor of mexCD-oprJ operon